MHFDELLEPITDARAAGLSIPSDWGQGRTAFGGVAAGMAYKAMRTIADSERLPRWASVAFTAPLSLDTEFGVDAELTASGRSVTQAWASAKQNETTAMTMQACFGVERESQVTVPGAEPPEIPGPDGGARLPLDSEVVPAFLQHVDLRITVGSLPFSGTATPRLGGWMRFREPPARLTDAHLLALIDAWPPTVLPMLDRPAPASSVAWNVEWIHPRPQIAPDTWLMYLASIRQAQAGYGHTEAAVWAASGELIALSRQLVAVYA